MSEKLACRASVPILTLLFRYSLACDDDDEVTLTLLPRGASSDAFVLFVLFNDGVADDSIYVLPAALACEVIKRSGITS